jgi:hypothetical protein
MDTVIRFLFKICICWLMVQVIEGRVQNTAFFTIIMIDDKRLIKDVLIFCFFCRDSFSQGKNWCTLFSWRNLVPKRRYVHLSLHDVWGTLLCRANHARCGIDQAWQPIWKIYVRAYQNITQSRSPDMKVGQCRLSPRNVFWAGVTAPSESSYRIRSAVFFGNESGICKDKKR